MEEVEKKYHIIIAQNSTVYNENLYTAWKKSDHFDNEFHVYSLYTESELAGDESSKFTEDEIEQLKAKLPENMKKIIDLGKIEVKGDEQWSF